MVTNLSEASSSIVDEPKKLFLMPRTWARTVYTTVPTGVRSWGIVEAGTDKLNSKLHTDGDDRRSAYESDTRVSLHSDQSRSDQIDVPVETAVEVNASAAWF